MIGGCGSTPSLDGPRDASAIDAEADARVTAIDAGSGIDAVVIDAPAATTDPFLALQAMAGLCTPDEWCWKFATPTGNDYVQVFGTGPDNIWLTGERGVVLQWDGHTWTRHQPPALPGQELVMRPVRITGTSSTSMWLILGSAVEHWNGVTWTIFQTGPITVAQYFGGIWAAPDNSDVWSVSNVEVSRSQNGGPFMPMFGGSNLTQVWGTSSDDVFITGPGTILHYDGQTITQVFSDGTRIPGGLQGVKNDVWAAGKDLLHWDGTSWTIVPTDVPANTGVQPSGWRATNDVWWFAGSASQNQSFVHWDGTNITVTPLDHASFGDACCPAIHSTAIIDDRWWLVGSAGHVSTKIGPNVLSPVVPAAYLGATLWGTSDDDMYFSQGNELHHWDGQTMTIIPTPRVGRVTGIAGAGIGGQHELFSISMRVDYLPYEEVYTAYHFDGATWTATDLSRMQASFLVPAGPQHYRLTTMYAIRAGEAMVVGEKGHAFHFKNGVWHPIATGVTADLRSVWGPDPDHLWISGTQGTLLQWDSTAPGVMTPDPSLPPTTDDLGSISGAEGIMWLANSYTTYSTLVRKRTAAGWSLEDANVQVQQLLAISATDVVASTLRNGRVTRWNGTEFVLEDFGSPGPMHFIFRPPGGHTWLTGGSGVVVHP